MKNICPVCNYNGLFERPYDDFSNNLERKMKAGGSRITESLKNYKVVFKIAWVQLLMQN